MKPMHHMNKTKIQYYRSNKACRRANMVKWRLSHLQKKSNRSSSMFLLHTCSISHHASKHSHPMDNTHNKRPTSRNSLFLRRSRPRWPRSRQLSIIRMRTRVRGLMNEQTQTKKRWPTTADGQDVPLATQECSHLTVKSEHVSSVGL